MNVERPDREYNLIDFIEQGKKQIISIDTTSFKHTIGNSIVPIDNIFRKYLPLITAQCKKITLTTEQLIEYRYDPKRLSLKLYNTMELWFVILMLNKLRSPMDFNIKTLYLLPPDKLYIINKINNVNKDWLDKNKANLDKRSFVI